MDTILHDIYIKVLNCLCNRFYGNRNNNNFKCVYKKKKINTNYEIR